MSRRSGIRFAGKDMRQHENLRRFPDRPVEQEAWQSTRADAAYLRSARDHNENLCVPRRAAASYLSKWQGSGGGVLGLV